METSNIIQIIEIVVIIIFYVLDKYRD